LLPRIRQNNIQLIEQYHSKDFKLLADPDMIRQVIMNLVLNAVDAMPDKGNMTISTRLSQDKSKGEFLEISICDTGSGIPPDILESLFDPFVKGKEQGLGLGLSISQRIAELHSGWISARNNPMEGSTFVVHLPIKSTP
jgi:signal transduction histidine kinase